MIMSERGPRIEIKSSSEEFEEYMGDLDGYMESIDAVLEGGDADAFKEGIKNMNQYQAEKLSTDLEKQKEKGLDATAALAATKVTVETLGNLSKIAEDALEGVNLEEGDTLIDIGNKISESAFHVDANATRRAGARILPFAPIVNAIGELGHGLYAEYIDKDPEKAERHKEEAYRFATLSGPPIVGGVPFMLREAVLMRLADSEEEKKHHADMLERIKGDTLPLYDKKESADSVVALSNMFKLSILATGEIVDAFKIPFVKKGSEIAASCLESFEGAIRELTKEAGEGKVVTKWEVMSKLIGSMSEAAGMTRDEMIEAFGEASRADDFLERFPEEKRGIMKVLGATCQSEEGRARLKKMIEDMENRVEKTKAEQAEAAA
ncbi:MAG: hypothetical protein ABIA47_01310 [bacterium]